MTARLDLRTVLLGSAAWAGALLGVLMEAAGLRWVAVGVVLLAAVVLGRRRRGWGGLLVACLLTAGAVAAAASARSGATSESPVAAWAQERAVVTAQVTVRSDPLLREGRFGDYVVVRGTLRTIQVRGRTLSAVVPILLFVGPAWQEVELGSRVGLTGRLGPATSAREAAVLSGRGAPQVLREPPAAFQAADQVRAAVRTGAARGPDDAAALVPALVTGDDQRLSEDLVEDFRAAGLTHLTAVSGTNLTLVLAFLLLVARWCRVSGRGLLVVGLLGVVGFVLLARPEPSVTRAAAMGTVALLGLGTGGRAAGVRALGVAVLVLLLLDPWLAVSAGFALSVLATAGILFVAPACRDALARWLPDPLAEAVAVPLAAQLACTPVVAAISGQVSLVAVAANLLAAPVVGPATVLGLLAGLVTLFLPVAGQLLGLPATWCAEVIVLVARGAAWLPGAAVDWPAHGAGIVALTLLSVAALVGAPWLLRRRAGALSAAVALVAVLVVPLPTPGWPPSGWVMVMCDVGQGDALVLAASAHQAVVVDAGPDPDLVDGCLRRLGVREVAAVVLTHFHADHVDGLPGVLAGRRVAEIQVTGFTEPEEGARQVGAWAAAGHVPVRSPPYGEVVRVGDLSWQVVAPRRTVSDNPNDASVVLLVETQGVRLLLAGDVEPASQAVLAQEPLAPVDVLKVPHHGSAHQDDDFLAGLGARVALVSVGADNTYGHPDPWTLQLLEDAGAVVRRSDEHGDVAVVVRDGALRVVDSG